MVLCGLNSSCTLLCDLQGFVGGMPAEKEKKRAMDGPNLTGCLDPARICPAHLVSLNVTS